MAEQVPKIKLNNGNYIPILGLGTWKAKEGDVIKAIKNAIDIGYRHIDCAHIYQNEGEIGEALHAKFKDGRVKRDDLFITSKLWNTMHRPDLVKPAIQTTLTNLGVEYLDLYLIHWPFGLKEDGDLFPVDENGKAAFSEVDYLDTWKAMEELVELGLTKSIGLSNFNKNQIERILANGKILPVVNQVEVHPYLNQKKIIEFCKLKGIDVIAYSPLGSPDRPWAKPDDVKLLNDSRITIIANKYAKTTAQVVLRYGIDRGLILIPKSVNKSRLEENFNIFDFKLSADDIDILDQFDCNGRICPYKDAFDHKYHPFICDEY